jgi:hypothetical protein
MSGGRLLYWLKRRWRDGITHVVYEPLECIAMLAALVPPPRFNLVRHSGMLQLQWPSGREQIAAIQQQEMTLTSDCTRDKTDNDKSCIKW